MDTAGQARRDFVEIDGLRIRVAVSGRGTPLLLIMGLGGHLGMWRPLQRAMSDFETITFDAPGTGGSSMPCFPLHMSALARLTTRLLDIMGYRQVDVLGVSLGGALAQQLTRQVPHRVRRLVLAATACGIGAVPGDLPTLLRMASPFRYYSRLYFERSAPSMYGGQLRVDQDFAREVAGYWATQPPNPWGYFGQMYALWGWTSLPWLHQIRQPTLVLTGDDDPIVPSINGKILAARIPNSQLHVVPGGHLFLLEQKDSVAGLVRAFLQAGAGT